MKVSGPGYGLAVPVAHNNHPIGRDDEASTAADKLAKPSTAAHKDNKPDEATSMIRQNRIWLFVLRPFC